MNSMPTMPVVEALSWTLIHFIWQGAVVALLLAIANKGLKRRSANLRYLAACLGMLTMLALPLVTFLTLRYYSPSATFAAADQTSSIESIRLESVTEGLADYLVQGSEPTRPRAVWEGRGGTFSQLAPWLTALWLAGVVVLSLRMLGGWLYARRLKNRLTGPLSREWQNRFARLRHDIRVFRPVRVLESALVRVPTVIGWLRPVVLIPASALVGLTPSQLEAVVAHELAHIRRYDYLVNLLQTAVEIILFYHPAVWWVSREIRQEREHCCDDVAVEVCGDALVYARALTEIEVLRNISPRLAMAADGGSLLARIQRILGNSPEGSDRTASWLAGAIVFVTVFVPAAGARFFSHHAEIERAAANVSTVTQTEAPEAALVSQITFSDKQGEKNRVNETDSRVASAANPPPEEMPSPATPSVDTPFIATPSVETPSVETPQLESPGFQAESGSFAEQMAALGYANLSVEDLEHLRRAGVSPSLVRELKSSGYEKLRVNDLARLARTGITGQFIKDLKDLGIAQVPLESLIRLAMHGVTPSLIKELGDLGYRSLNLDQLMEAARHGVTPQYIRGLQSAGYRDLQMDELVRARDHGVAVEFIKEIGERGYSSLPMKELIRMKDHGVDDEFIRSMEAGGFGHLPVDHLVRARDHGVDPEFARQVRAAGFPNVSLEQLIRMMDQGVTVSYIASIRKSGMDNVSLEQLMRLRSHGVDAEFIRRAGSNGVHNLTIEQLIRLRDADVFN